MDRPEPIDPKIHWNRTADAVQRNFGRVRDALTFASMRSATSDRSDLGFRISALRAQLSLAKIETSPFTGSIPEDCMSSRLQEATEAEAKTEGIDDLLAQAQALAERVEAMPDGPMKQKLRVALAEIKCNVGEIKPEVRHAG
jgi:hypothetical protein